MLTYDRFTSTIVTIKAGSGGRTQDFHVHEDVIKDGSSFFRAAFDRKWREGQSRILELPDDKPATVFGYLEWLYSGQVKFEAQQELSSGERGIQDNDLSRMYVFGKKLQDDAFCDEVMKRSLMAVTRCAKMAEWFLTIRPSVSYTKARQVAHTLDVSWLISTWLEAKSIG